MTGSRGERELQQELGSQDRAARFYDRQMRDTLSESMQQLIARQEMMFVATADAKGNCDCSPRFGKPGFVTILDEKTLAYPEYRGNGVYASLGNLRENPHLGFVFVDFFDTTVGLHVNGSARICSPEDVPEQLAAADSNGDGNDAGRLIEGWVIIEVDEAYIHCSKHVPLLHKEDKPIDWGTDDPDAKSEAFFLE